MTSTSASSLRKACRTCTKRKRKCIVELPKCQRCHQRNLKCVYDLEPLVTSKVAVQRRRTIHASVEASKKNDAFLYYISSLHMSNKIHTCVVNRSLVTTFSAVPLTQDPEAVEYIIQEMLYFPGRVHRGEPTPFIHPCLHEQTPGRHLDFRVEAEIPQDHTNNHFVQNTMTMPLAQLLAVTQALILFLIQHAFGQKDLTSKPIETGFQVLMKWRTLLWSRGFRAMPDDLTPWQSWLLGESVRPTILMSYLVEGTYSARRRGWCIHRLFVYALPFSTQGSLWLADTEDEWSALVGTNVNTVGDTAQELVSFEEFTRTFAKTPFQPGDDLFQKLLLISHHGRVLVEDRLNQLDTRRDESFMPVMSFGK